MAAIHSRDDYSVGWISALSIELTAATGMLDTVHDDLELATGDNNAYTLGNIGSHNVVIAVLPSGTIGTSSAAATARDMMRSFSKLRFVFMVGIGGGAPDANEADAERDIRLGDVVVSKPSQNSGGVVQYDFGKLLQEGIFRQTGHLDKSPTLVLSCVSKLQSQHLMKGSMIANILANAHEGLPLTKHKFARPDDSTDLLFTSDYQPNHDDHGCRDCDKSRLVQRLTRAHQSPVVHYGIIASANKVLRDAMTRDRLRKDFGVLCFEMEAAGLMDICPCLVIRGICDYSDAHKNKLWQPYAALTAAAYAKELLQTIPAVVTANSCSNISSIHGSTTGGVSLAGYESALNDQELNCLQTFKTSDYEGMKNRNPNRASQTCQWFFGSLHYERWSQSTSRDLLWVTADPGCGKSVLAKSVIDKDLKRDPTDVVAYFFFKDNSQQDKLQVALCALIHQVLSQRKHLVRLALPFWMENGANTCNNTEALWRLFLAVTINNEVATITCVIDALDECKYEDKLNLISKLTEFWTTHCNVNSKAGLLKFLVTSRPYDDIVSNFEGRLRVLVDELPNIRIKGEDENDMLYAEIDKVLVEEVAKLKLELNLNPEVALRLQKKLQAIPNRTYLWLRLVLEDFRQRHSNSLWPQQETINEIPRNLQDVYCSLLDGVQEARRLTVLHILQIVTCSHEPLPLGSIAVALTVIDKPRRKYVPEETMSKDLLKDCTRSWCGLFVYIDRGCVYLIHQTAKEFLLRDPPDRAYSGWRYTFSASEMEVTMTKICVRYLLSTQGMWLRDALMDFQDYCLDNWYLHVAKAETAASFPLDLVLKLYDIATFDKWLPAWFSVHLRYGGIVPRGYKNGIFRSHNYAYIKKYRGWRQIYGIYSDEPHQWTPFHLAAFFGHCEVLKKLRGDRISLATVFGTDRIMAMMQGDHTFDLIKNENPGPSMSALIIAADQGRTEAVKLLLAMGSNVNCISTDGTTALHRASRNGHSDIVRILLQANATVDKAKRKCKSAALIEASKGRSAEVIKILLDNGADIDAMNEWNETPLNLAARYGTEAMACILLENDADPDDLCYKEGKPPLMAAVLAERKDLVQLLLDRGADVNCEGYIPYRDDDFRGVNYGYGTPLAAALFAIKCRDQAIVSLLRKHGAVIGQRIWQDGRWKTRRDNDERTPLEIDIPGLKIS